MTRINLTGKVINIILIFTGILMLTSLTAFASEDNHNPDPDFAQVESVRMVYRTDGRWDVHVAVLHNDEGWDHYANIWQVVDSTTDKVIGERILAHPHDNEQPFTRSLTGLVIPGDVREVRIRSRCNLHDYGGREIAVEIPADITEGSTILIQCQCRTAQDDRLF